MAEGVLGEGGGRAHAPLQEESERSEGGKQEEGDRGMWNLVGLTSLRRRGNRPCLPADVYSLDFPTPQPIDSNGYLLRTTKARVHCGYHGHLVRSFRFCRLFRERLRRL